MFLSRNASGDKNPQMTNGLVDRVDNCLSIVTDLIDVVIKIKNPSERLLGRSDIVALRAKYNDWRPDISKIDRRAI